MSPSVNGNGGLEFMSSSGAGGHRELKETVNKFLKGFFMLSAM